MKSEAGHRGGRIAAEEVGAQAGPLGRAAKQGTRAGRVGRKWGTVTAREDKTEAGSRTWGRWFEQEGSLGRLAACEATATGICLPVR